MESYIKGEITVTAEQLEHAKAKARKKMHAATIHRPDLLSFDSFGFSFDEQIRSVMDVACDYDGNSGALDWNVGRLIIGSLEEDRALGKLQERIWKKYRLDKYLTTEALIAAVDEIFDASLKFLGVKVKAAGTKAAQKPVAARDRLRRAA